LRSVVANSQNELKNRVAGVAMHVSSADSLRALPVSTIVGIFHVASSECEEMTELDNPWALNGLYTKTLIDTASASFIAGFMTLFGTYSVETFGGIVGGIVAYYIIHYTLSFILQIKFGRFPCAERFSPFEFPPFLAHAPPPHPLPFLLIPHCYLELPIYIVDIYLIYAIKFEGSCAGLSALDR